MRHHFHRCMNLRVVSVSASDLRGPGRGGGVILEELCEARKLTPCVGLIECEVLTSGQKQELLVERATRLREEEGRPVELAGLPKERRREIEGLREQWVRERDEIVEANRRLEAEIGGAQDRELLGAPGQDRDLREAGLSFELEPAYAELRIRRLDDVDRAIEAMEDRVYGTCALCGGEIAMERLRLAPETRVCSPCAGRAPEPRRLEPSSGA